MNNKSKSKIIDLLYGKMYTYSERIDFDRECIELEHKALDVEEEIYGKLKDNAELTALFDKFIEFDAVADNAENDVYFSEGFKTGLLIGIEAGEWMRNKAKR